jgi:neutral ceramidase
MLVSRATRLLAWALVAAFIQTLSLAADPASTTGRRQTEPYLVGVGKADITGPISDVQMMGYANPDQIAGGLHTRLWARSFIVVDRDTGNRVVFVNLDACMASQAVTFTVIDRLQGIYGPSVYSADNVVLSGTHTHSGPAGYLQYLIYDITGLGFVKETFDALVEGIVLSIVRAHDGLAPGRLRAGKTRVDGANVNRSPTAYAKNPQWERDMYEDDVDKELTLLRVEDEEGRGIGAFSWFAVHGTSMNNTNRLINGDNKGAAALFMEEDMGSGFVAAFCQANVGDTSPNTLGAFCMDTGLPCDAVHSTCDGRVQQCIGRGPGWPDHFESTRIVASKQHDAAVRLFDDDKGLRSVSGAVESMHVYLDMSNITVWGRNGVRAGKTCKPAMGFSFAAGTTDGPGAFDFQQSDTHGSAFWRLVRDFITTPTEEQERCHAPKPILLDVGEMHYPYEWAPSVVEISIVRIGNFVILAVPGELTTMSGRRLVRAIGEKVTHAWGLKGGSSGTSDVGGEHNGKERHLHIVIGGLSNTYSSYVTTFEEYQEQRYEGGFTLFGPHTLDAYIQEFARVADCMIGDGGNDSDGEKQKSKESRGDLNRPCEDPGPRPPDLLDDQWSLVPGVIVDAVPWGARFGDTIRDVENRIYRPKEIVEVEFRAASPRNDFKTGDTYLQVERLVAETTSFLGRLGRGALRLIGMDRAMVSARWVVEYTDSSWSTQYEWQRRTPLSPYSFATIRWSIPSSVTGGLYRIRYLGTSKNLLGQVTDFEGTSSEFKVHAA